MEEKIKYIGDKKKNKETTINNEPPEQRFKRLANRRMRNALIYIKLLGNLADKSNYSYTDAQKNEVISELRKAIRQVENRFGQTRKVKKKFRTF